jgi:hypothetical protein
MAGLVSETILKDQQSWSCLFHHKRGIKELGGVLIDVRIRVLDQVINATPVNLVGTLRFLCIQIYNACFPGVRVYCLVIYQNTVIRSTRLSKHTPLGPHKSAAVVVQDITSACI